MGLLHQLNNDLSIFGCTGSFLLHMGSLSLWRVGAALYLLTVAASLVEHRLSACGLQELLHVGSVAVARGLQSAGSVVVVHGA